MIVGIIALLTIAMGLVWVANLCATAEDYQAEMD